MFTCDNNLNETAELILHLTISAISVYLMFALMPTVSSIYKWLYLSIVLTVLILDVYFLFTAHRNFMKISRLILFYLGGILFLTLAIFYVTKIIVLTDTYGFEELLKEHLQTAKYIFFFISFAQPILLPIPEAVTIPGASAVLGPLAAASVAFLGTILGISTMFFGARYGGRKFVFKLIKEDQVKKYQTYISKNETFIMFILFIIPVLPDEIICAGAGIGQVSPRKFLLVASISKMMTATLLAYSVQLAEIFSITSSQLILGLSAAFFIVFGLSFLTKKLLSKEQASERNSSSK